MGTALLQGVQEPIAGDRVGVRDSRVNAGDEQVPRLLPGNGLCGFSGWSGTRKSVTADHVALHVPAVRIAARSAQAKLFISPEDSRIDMLRQKRPRLKLDVAAYEKLRLQVLERDGWRCQSCGRQENLQAHHVNPRSNLGDDALVNLITLCANCHRTAHLGK